MVRKPGPGDYVKVSLMKQEYKGILLETSKDEKGILLLKLDSGYNIGLIKKEVREVKVLRKGKDTSEKIEIKKDVGNIVGKDVLIIEDIVDTGFTLDYLKKYLLEEKNARSVKICCITDKKCQRKCDIKADYTGFIVPDKFIVFLY